ncbi:lysophospholipid acyltransferase family protein [Pontibacter sp. G13]|uniref:lysophospholipid acyltransferase family protein n=1 Tax=Pontibacter sp. G13 TaxID=3074898 RepID=UPI00288A33FE|nr:lysophospholipid acyltransferase family protein [Pontibacter sp. G13]WNJ17647.1 lysophospholipid acyltransferase family protein [Pontibacter sp. G13]
MLLKGLQAIYSLYVMVMFFLTAIPTLLLYVLMAWLPRKRFMRFVYAYNYVWIKLWGYLCLIRFEVKGLDLKDDDQVYIITPNHNNLFDLVITCSQLQHLFQPLIKKELLKYPLIGQLFALTSVPVDRSSKESRAESLKVMTERLDSGMSILLFPEGTRNRTDKPVKNFYDGAFKLAIQAQVPVLPVVYLNTRLLQPVDTFWIKPGKITIEYIRPVPTEGMTLDDMENLKQHVHDLMESHILLHDRAFSESADSKV